MAYIKCPSCGNSNRDTDSKCYSCETDLNAAPSEPPPMPERRIAPVGGEAPRRGPQKLDRESTWQQGLRAGLAGGAVFGLLPAGMGGLLGAMFGSLGGAAAAGMAAAMVFALVWVTYLFQGFLLGLIVGKLNVLCYSADCAKIGWWFGMVRGLLAMASGGSFTGIFWAGAWGAALGGTISWAEKVLFRKQTF